MDGRVEEVADLSCGLNLLSDAVQANLLPSTDQADDLFEGHLIKAMQQVINLEFPISQPVEAAKFWDERKAATWRSQSIVNKPDSFTITKPAIAALKRTTLAFTLVTVDDEFECEAVSLAYRPNEWLEGEMLIPREPTQRKLIPGHKKVIKTFNKLHQLEPVYNDKALCDLWKRKNLNDAQKL